jgi:mRNA interferase RelE/StbE
MPGYAVEFLPTAAREFKKLPLDLKQPIGVQIEALRLDPRPLGAKTLQGGNGQLRIRVGGYRVIDSLHPPPVTFRTQRKPLYGRCASGLLGG